MGHIPQTPISVNNVIPKGWCSEATCPTERASSWLDPDSALWEQLFHPLFLVTGSAFVRNSLLSIFKVTLEKIIPGGNTVSTEHFKLVRISRPYSSFKTQIVRDFQSRLVVLLAVTMPKKTYSASDVFPFI